ncbi:MAG: TetR/AcrR family transcriptional regulator [Anaerolineales bacterium]|nr:TetR/AcrR family transcriptional regulator [Anaerolineales bacterium]
MSRTRRTQEERSQVTRQQLLEATIDIVHERGYQNASTNEIVARAGVSRGALLHHYPTKIDLLSAAFQYAHEQIIADVARLMAQTRAIGGDWTDALDDIWSRLFRGRLWDFTLDMAVAARGDEALAQHLDPTLHSYRTDLDKVWSQYFLSSDSTAESKRLLNLTFCVMRGIALQTVLREDPQFYEDMMREWKGVLEVMLRDKG